LKLLDFAIWDVLQAKVPATTHADLGALRLSIAVEWDRLSPEYICKICCPFHCHWYAVTPKNEVYIESMVSQQPNTHQPVLFRATIKASRRCEGLLQKNILVHD
jgi:hypothetical protein